LAPFRTVLPYIFLFLSIGFRYLGFYLTTGPKKNTEWNWLLSKMKKKNRSLVQ
jgi:hypothetical protein